MKKLLILIGLIVLFVKFNPFPEVDDFIEEKSEPVIELWDKITDPNLQAKAKNVVTNLGENWQYYSEEQQEYVQQITDSKEQLEAFLDEYCKQSKVNPILFGDRLKEVCSVALNQLAMMD